MKNKKMMVKRKNKKENEKTKERTKMKNRKENKKRGIEKRFVLMRTLQNRSKFSKRSLKEQNLAILETANFAKRFIQTSLIGIIFLAVSLMAIANSLGDNRALKKKGGNV